MMRNRPYHINRKRGIASLDQFCNGPLQNWFLNTDPPFGRSIHGKDCPDFARMRSLVMSFRGILQSGKAATLARWMKKAVASGIYGMKRFVRKLNHDLAAVKNALRESWSNGPVEGHINRLKTLKRQMYGRA